MSFRSQRTPALEITSSDAGIANSDTVLDEVEKAAYEDLVQHVSRTNWARGALTTDTKAVPLDKEGKKGVAQFQFPLTVETLTETLSRWREQGVQVWVGKNRISVGRGKRFKIVGGSAPRARQQYTKFFDVVLPKLLTIDVRKLQDQGEMWAAWQRAGALLAATPEEQVPAVPGDIQVSVQEVGMLMMFCVRLPSPASRGEAYSFALVLNPLEPVTGRRAWLYTMNVGEAPLSEHATTKKQLTENQIKLTPLLNLFEISWEAEWKWFHTASWLAEQWGIFSQEKKPRRTARIKKGARSPAASKVIAQGTVPSVSFEEFVRGMELLLKKVPPAKEPALSRLGSILTAPSTSGRLEEQQELAALLKLEQYDAIALVSKEEVGAGRVLCGAVQKAYAQGRVIELDGVTFGAFRREEQIREIFNALFFEAVSHGETVLYLRAFSSLFLNIQLPERRKLFSFLLSRGGHSSLRIVFEFSSEEVEQLLQLFPEMHTAVRFLTISEPSEEELLTLAQEHALKLKDSIGSLLPAELVQEVTTFMHYLPIGGSVVLRTLQLLERVTVRYHECALEGKVFEKEQIKELLPDSIKEGIKALSAQELLQLKERIKEEVKGQDDALSHLCSSLLPGLLGLRTGERPYGIYLFAGPSGVGKTLTARRLASLLYGDWSSFVRVSVSDLGAELGRSRGEGSTSSRRSITGEFPGFGGAPRVLYIEQVEHLPPAMLESVIRSLLMQLTGNPLNALESIVILSTTVGTEELARRQRTLNCAELPYNEVSEVLQDQLRGTFGSEVLHLVDRVVCFKPLHFGMAVEIVQTFFMELQRKLQKKNILLTMTEESKAFIASQGISPLYGARYLSREFDRLVAEPLAEQVLSGKILPYSLIEVDISAKGFSWTVGN